MNPEGITLARVGLVYLKIITDEPLIEPPVFSINQTGTADITDEITEISVLIESNRVMFFYGNYTIFTHIIEGRYPD